jgi:hypothetical protein
MRDSLRLRQCFPLADETAKVLYNPRPKKTHSVPDHRGFDPIHHVSPASVSPRECPYRQQFIAVEFEQPLDYRQLENLGTKKAS